MAVPLPGLGTGCNAPAGPGRVGMPGRSGSRPAHEVVPMGQT